MTVDDERPLRADAQQNEGRILEVAARVFNDGGDTSVRAIAREAEVGIGTLYRRFPTREHLVEAVYRNESARLCRSVPRLLDELFPMEALRTWMDDFVGYLLTKEGMAGSLRAVFAAAEDLRMRTRQLLIDAMTTLMNAAIADGTIRADVDPQDVLMCLGGIALIVGSQDQRPIAGRLVNLLLDGLRWTPAS